MIKPVVLGEIDLPSGVLIVLDPGLARFWRHDSDPRSPRRADGEDVDLAIVGPDAVMAGRAFDRQFDPRYLFDIPIDRLESWRAQFAEFVAERRFDARLELLGNRVPHTERARLAVEVGGGAGVVTYNRLWAVAVGGLPVDRPLPVMATSMPQGEFAGRWRSIDVVVDPTVEVARTEITQGVMVEHGELLCADLDALGEFRMWESLDGLGDFVFWGADAADLAVRVGARTLNDHEFGWTALPMAEVDTRAAETRRIVKEQGLQLGIDYRPHDNLERLNAQVRVNKSRAGMLLLNGVRACGFDNRWGDGIFTVARHLGPAGQLVRVRLDVGDDDTQRRLRRVLLMVCGATISNLVWDEGHPPRFIERMPAIRSGDSGWCVSSGAESKEFMDDPKNFRIVEVRQLVDRYPALKKVIDAPVGSLFRLENDAYVLD
jgi:hypothetical protein